MNPSYSYLFVRTDLSLAQQIVQGSHAAMDAGFAYSTATTPNIVLIGASNHDELLEIADLLHGWNIDHQIFFEPDIGQHTAIATKPLQGDERKHLRKFRLLRHADKVCGQEITALNISNPQEKISCLQQDIL